MTTTFSRSLALFALVLSGCASTSTEHPCTALGCQNGYSLDLSAAAWPAGTYLVELVVDGQKGTCEATLPLTEASRAVCSLPGVRLELSGSALPPAQHALAALAWSGSPAKVDVTVKVNGATLGKPASFTPAYRTTQPNGPRCEPTCSSAHDRLSL